MACVSLSISTLDFGPFSTKLGGTVQAIKKMTQNDNGPGLGRNDRETAVVMFSEKVFFSPPPKTQFLKRLILIWEKATFFF